MPTVQSVVRTDAGLASELRVSVMRLRRRLVSERSPDHALSLTAAAVLGALHRCGDLTLGALAARERVRPPSMTRTVTALEELGYVVRRPDERDGRAVLVHLTDLGRSTVLDDRRRRDEWLARRLRDLTPDDRDVLRRAAPILERLADID